MKRNFRLLIAILITAAAVPFVTWNSGSARSNDEKFRKSKQPVRDQYIVVLKSETAADEVEPVANELLAAHGGTVRHVYTHALKGFSIQLPEAVAHVRKPSRRCSKKLHRTGHHLRSHCG